MAVTAYTTKKGRRYKAELWQKGRRLLVKRGFLTKKDARGWIFEAETKLEKLLQSQTDTAFSSIATKYLDEMQARRQRNTYRYKRSAINRFLTFMEGDFLAPDLKFEQIKEFHMDQNTKRGAKCANRDIKELMFMTNWAIKNDILQKNPFRRIEPFPEEAFMRRVPTAEDIQKIRIVATREEREWVDTLYYTGARLGEIIKLQWKDVDFKRKTITLWTRKRRAGNNEPRTQALTKGLAKIFERRWNDPERHEELVFPDRRGKEYSRATMFLRTLFARLCDKAGVERFTAHGIRHHVATRLKDSKQASPYQIQHFLGHKNLRTTEIYLHQLEIDREVGDILTLDSIDLE
ncbi:site-specific integrase [Desulfobaculum bizertense]|uniref:tyrosine-type recombinase/integrase n=1 Tax=Desulfobaculum bizertense TaxID=376490 RepID=UPI001F266C1B|nr:site-specific integrase [Desulfobaculum bizertense]UIJ38697.1 site-specific integrase [Desulfobaculum bizertense]